MAVPKKRRSKLKKKVHFYNSFLKKNKKYVFYKDKNYINYFYLFLLYNSKGYIFNDSNFFSKKYFNIFFMKKENKFYSYDSFFFFW